MSKKKALIVSLNFRAAHISHLVASYRQMQELGYEVYCFIHPDAIEYMPDGVKYVTDIDNIGKVDVSIFWFPSLKNISSMLQLRFRHGSKIIYVFHEPIEKFGSYLASGNSRWWTLKFFMKYYVGLSFLALSDIVLLPSNKAVALYSNGLSRYANRKYFYLPLMYADERTDEHVHMQRKYISYIGGISNDHAFNEFVEFIYKSYRTQRFNGVKYLIASWRSVPENKMIDEMLSAGILDVYAGRPMSNEEINTHYASSLVVWNAYNRSTQSGVLAKSFMFGTPGLVMKKNLSEFVQDGREVIAIDNNRNFDQIASAIDKVLNAFPRYSENARNNYERNYDYSKHNLQMSEILSNL